MLILSYLQQFLNTNLNNLYKSQRNNVRKHYSIPANDKLWFNGFDYKIIIFINGKLCLEACKIPIQRMVWIKNSGERTHIYLRPSFIIKRCPFPTCTLEYIWNVCIACGTEPFDTIQDPEGLLDSSMPLEYYTRKIFKILGSSNYMIKWNHLHHKVFNSLLPEAEKEITKPGLISEAFTYHLIRLFAKGLGMEVAKHDYLSFANFQFPLK